jgi:hypothetical protein
MAERGTIQKIAEAASVNQATVRRALSAAGMTAGRGGYPFAEAVEAVKAIADTSRVIGHAANGRGEGGSSSHVQALGEAKVRRESLQARRLEIENAKAEGSLIDRDAVTETGINVIVAARTAILALGYRCAERVAVLTDVKEIAKIIEDEARIVLSALADPQTFLDAIEMGALS